MLKLKTVDFNRFLFLILLLCALTSSWPMRALGLIKPQIGLGLTDNANLEQTAKDADFFWWARLLGTHSFEAWDADLWMSVKDYAQQNTNDNFVWRASFSTPFDDKPFRGLTGEILFGQVQYLHGSASNTDTSYNNSYLGANVSSEFMLGSQPSEWETGLLLTSYPDFHRRTDFDLHGLLTINLVTAELGIINSTDNYFSRTYLGLDFDWSEQEQSRWQMNLAMSVRYSFFPYRTLLQSNRTSTKRRGSVSVTTQEENEMQMLLQFNPGISKIYGKTEVKLGINLNSQSSRSQTADYFETVLLASVQSSF